MKKQNIIIFIIILSLVTLMVTCQDGEIKDSQTAEVSKAQIIEYDSLTAKKYGADEYGMKKYVIAFLKKGTNHNLDSTKTNELQTAHLRNIQTMGNEGKLIIAGPFFGDGDLRGIYIFNVKSIEEAEKLTNSDPAIQAGILAMELKEWYGPAALMMVNDVNETLTKKKIIPEK